LTIYIIIAIIELINVRSGMKRRIDLRLLEWKMQPKRKPMVVRGARQVGKTFSIRVLGKSFKSFVEVNFEETDEVKAFFSGNLDPAGIIEKLSLYYKIPIIENESLLFFDEIQACPEAFRSLRFFYEKMPGLHVIAAGSLLEFALSRIASFGVGRIEYSYMYPLSFPEFLDATQEENLGKIIAVSGYGNPVHEVFHATLLERLKIYLILGGMPEAVRCYAESKNILECQKILDGLLTAFYDDFAKYKARLPVIRLKEVFKSTVLQAGTKFKYSRISGERATTYKECLDALVEAGLAYKVYHTSARGLPLGAQVDEKKFKVVFFDTGLFQRMLGLNLSEFIVSDFNGLINRGQIAETFSCCEMIANHRSDVKPEIYYWHRESRASNAEVDYVVSVQDRIIPIEVKAGTKGQMQSMMIFLEERGLENGVRISAENFARYGNIFTVPLYAAGNIWRLF
jgi:predicted AAA+ superfamily ATPase